MKTIFSFGVCPSTTFDDFTEIVTGFGIKTVIDIRNNDGHYDESMKFKQFAEQLTLMMKQSKHGRHKPKGQSKKSKNKRRVANNSVYHWLNALTTIKHIEKISNDELIGLIRPLMAPMLILGSKKHIYKDNIRAHLCNRLYLCAINGTLPIQHISQSSVNPSPTRNKANVKIGSNAKNDNCNNGDNKTGDQNNSVREQTQESKNEIPTQSPNANKNKRKRKKRRSKNANTESHNPPTKENMAQNNPTSQTQNGNSKLDINGNAMIEQMKDCLVSSKTNGGHSRSNSGTDTSIDANINSKSNNNSHEKHEMKSSALLNDGPSTKEDSCVGASGNAKFKLVTHEIMSIASIRSYSTMLDQWKAKNENENEKNKNGNTKGNSGKQSKANGKKGRNGKGFAHRRQSEGLSQFILNPTSFNIFSFLGLTANEVQNAECFRSAKKFLAKNGYLVLSNVLNDEEVAYAQHLLWDYLEQIDSGIKRNDPSTWGNENWPERFRSGVMAWYGVGQSPFLWYLRSHPNVVNLFKKIWFPNFTLTNNNRETKNTSNGNSNTNSNSNPTVTTNANTNNGSNASKDSSNSANNADSVGMVRNGQSENKSKDFGLLTSFDGCGAFRPYTYDASWKTSDGWLHFDQSPLRNSNFECLQGLINLVDATPDTGGFYCIPATHKTDFVEFGKRNENRCSKHEYGSIMIPKSDPLFGQTRICLGLKKGDFLLWDSRLVHCNVCARKDFIIKNNESENENEHKRNTTMSNKGGNGGKKSKGQNKNGNEKQSVGLIRTVAYICMVPRRNVHRQMLANMIQQRKGAVFQQLSTNHMPFVFLPNKEAPSRFQKGLKPLKTPQRPKDWTMTPQQWKLVIGT